MEMLAQIHVSRAEILKSGLINVANHVNGISVLKSFMTMTAKTVDE